jgi:hypothetical protein
MRVCLSFGESSVLFCLLNNQHGIAASNDQIDLASSPPLEPWDLAAPSSDFINANGNHRDADSFVTSPSHNASPNQALAGTLDATATRDQHIPIWSPNLSSSNHGSQQQAVSTANNGWNNGWNPDVSIAPPAWDPASQGLAQSLSHVTPDFGQRFIPASSSVDYPPVHSNAIANGQPDPTLQRPDSGVYTDFGVVPNNFANFNSLTQWADLPAIDPQPTMTSFNNQLPFPTTTSMPAAPALPTHATSIFTAPALPHPIARRVTSRRSNVNTNPHTCNYPGCGEIITRLGDLTRHRQKHGVPQHPCIVHGCSRRGPRAFYRTDKLRDHQRKKHRMAI